MRNPWPGLGNEAGHVDTASALGAMLGVLLLALVVAAASGVAVSTNADLQREALALLAVMALGALLGVLAAFWPLRLRLQLRRSALDPAELTTASMRDTFARALEYRDGLERMVWEVDDPHLRPLLRQIVRDLDRPLRNIFRLARQVETYRQDGRLGEDYRRLQAKQPELTVEERAQLATLDRLDGAARVGGQLVGDMAAILGRLYAQSKEITLLRDVEETRARLLVEDLRTQATQLHHLADALREVYGDDSRQS